MTFQQRHGKTALRSPVADSGLISPFFVQSKTAPSPSTGPAPVEERLVSYHHTKPHPSVEPWTCHRTGTFSRPKHPANCFEHRHYQDAPRGLMRPRHAAGVVVAFTLGPLVLFAVGCSWPVVVRPRQARSKRLMRRAGCGWLVDACSSTGKGECHPG